MLNSPFQNFFFVFFEYSVISLIKNFRAQWATLLLASLQRQGPQLTTRTLQTIRKITKNPETEIKVRIKICHLHQYSVSIFIYILSTLIFIVDSFVQCSLSPNLIACAKSKCNEAFNFFCIRIFFVLKLILPRFPISIEKCSRRILCDLSQPNIVRTKVKP